MRKFLTTFILGLSFVALTGFSGCAGVGTFGTTLSPEAMIKLGADTNTAAITTATVLLRNQKITLSEAKSYRVMLGGAVQVMDDANATLLACRAKTGSNAKTSPDPCALAVTDILKLALDGIVGVKATLDKISKQ